MQTSFSSIQNSNALFNPALFTTTTPRPSPSPNHILAALPAADYQKLVTYLEPVQLTAGQVLCEAGDRMHFIYFPTTATISIMSMTAAGETCELTMTSCDGLMGFATALGSDASAHRVVVQLSGQALRMRTHDFMAALNDSPTLRRLVMSHVQIQLFHMAQSVVCNRHHSIMDRLCFWLLSNTEYRTTPALPVTHEMVASLLGVRRESITQAAGKLQTDGLISTRRGQVSIHDRAALAARACECFDRVKSEKNRLFAWAVADTDDDVSLPQVHRHIHHMADSDDEIDENLQDKYRDLYEFAPVGFVTLDLAGRIVQTNLSAAILLGVSPSQSQHKVFTQWLEKSSQAPFTQFHQEVLSGKCRRHCDVSIINQTRQIPTRVRLQAVADEEGQECRMVMIDLSAGQPIQTPTPKSTPYEGLMLEHVPFMLWVKNKQGRFVTFNPLFAQYLGVQMDADGGLMPQTAAHAHRFNALRSLHDGSIATLGNGSMVEVCLDVDDEARWYEVSQSPIQSAGDEGLIMGCARDITERKSLQVQLNTTATTDALTQLSNRRFFLTRMEDVYSRLHLPTSRPTLVLFDLDNFKQIHVQWGQAAGDHILQQVATRLQNHFTTADCIARLGGHEFGVLIEQCAVEDEAQWQHQIQLHLNQAPFLIGQEQVFLSFSIGISQLMISDDSVQTALNQAEEALALRKDMPIAPLAGMHLLGPAIAPASGIWS